MKLKAIKLGDEYLWNKVVRYAKYITDLSLLINFLNERSHNQIIMTDNIFEKENQKILLKLTEKTDNNSQE